MMRYGEIKNQIRKLDIMELIFIWVVSAALSPVILDHYNQEKIGLLLGVIFGPLGVLFALVIRSNESKKEDKKRHYELMAALDRLSLNEEQEREGA